jgi:hypothetical protein
MALRRTSPGPGESHRLGGSLVFRDWTRLETVSPSPLSCWINDSALFAAVSFLEKRGRSDPVSLQGSRIGTDGSRITTLGQVLDDAVEQRWIAALGPLAQGDRDASCRPGPQGPARFGKLDCGVPLAQWLSQFRMQVKRSPLASHVCGFMAAHHVHRWNRYNHVRRWTTGGRQYVAAVRRYDEEIGSLERAAPRDLICEVAVSQRTGLSVREHQRRTVDNFVELQMLWVTTTRARLCPSSRETPRAPIFGATGAQRRRPTTSKGGGNKHRVFPERACLYTTRRRKLAFCARSRRVTVHVRPTAGRCRVRASEARR